MEGGLTGWKCFSFGEKGPLRAVCSAAEGQGSPHHPRVSGANGRLPLPPGQITRALPCRLYFAGSFFSPFYHLHLHL